MGNPPVVSILVNHTPIPEVPKGKAKVKYQTCRILVDRRGALPSDQIRQKVTTTELPVRSGCHLGDLPLLEVGKKQTVRNFEFRNSTAK